jgi:hypothetical protein
MRFLRFCELPLKEVDYVLSTYYRGILSSRRKAKDTKHRKPVLLTRLPSGETS